MKYAMSKISNIWGVEGLEKQTTKFYTNKLWFILKEYLKSSELEEVKTLVSISLEVEIVRYILFTVHTFSWVFIIICFIISLL